MQLREALAAKQPVETHYDLQVADPTAAQEQLQAANRQVTLATLREDTDGLETAKHTQEEAQAAVQACFYRLRFRNLAPHEFEALVAAHPATAAQQAKKEVWNRDSLTAPLLAACTVDSDLTTAEWEAELGSGRWSAADKVAAYRAALDCNVTQRSATLPFA